MPSLCSVVITTHDRSVVLPRALGSLLQQTYRDIEVIVIDDGSTDGTDVYMETVTDPRVRSIKLSTNQGASAARNRGIVEAKGEFIMVWDSDDVLYPNALSSVLAEFTRDSSLTIVSAPARIITNGIENPFPRVPSGKVAVADIFCKKIGSNEKIRVARADVMKSVSYKARHIDFLVNMELIERGEWYHIDEYLGDVFNDPMEGSLTASRKKKSSEGSIERAPYLGEFLMRHEKALLAISPRRYADYAYGASIGYLLMGDTNHARAFAWRAWRNHLLSFKYLTLWKLSWMPGGKQLLELFYR